MKKLAILFSIALYSVCANAQLTVKPHISMNFSVLTSDVIDYEDPALRFGWMLGAGVKFGEDFYVEPGVEWTYNTFEMIHENDDNLDHISIIKGLRVPVVAGYQFGANDDIVRFRIFAGPSATFILGIHDEGNTSGIPDKEDISNVIWSGTAGIGLDVWFLYLETGYDFGLSNYYSNTSQYGTGKQNVFWISLGLNLGG